MSMPYAPPPAPGTSPNDPSTSPPSHKPDEVGNPNPKPEHEAAPSQPTPQPIHREIPTQPIHR
jgi:hypothetical protein